jgi:hypothetical protein
MILMTVNILVCSDPAHGQPSRPISEGTKYDTAQQLELFGGLSRDVMQFNVLELRSLLDVAYSMQ